MLSFAFVYNQTQTIVKAGASSFLLISHISEIDNQFISTYNDIAQKMLDTVNFPEPEKSAPIFTCNQKSV